VNWSIPTIGAIQRTNLLLVGLSTGLLAFLDSRAAAAGCLLGGAVVIGNLYILAMLGWAVLAAAGGGRAAHRAGVLAIPLKLLLIAGLVYLVFARVGVDALGFGLGVLTQLLAILIETGRASLRPATATRGLSRV
jgi:hypothetical protein